MWIPENLITHRIMGRNRIEPCGCGHFHIGKRGGMPHSTLKGDMEAVISYLNYIADLDIVTDNERKQ